ncbi:cell envelope integrity protein TolA [Oribacterium sinus]|uniref:cell envelope integrity protein TolA n=1 Tax=Oribacterium sinus TaxID=237576 RepID=UPI0028EF61B8|nr:cell envelope integrity protein TolA [Oribacterium sinus]
MGKKKGEKQEGKTVLAKHEKSLAKKAEKKAEKKRQRQEREQALEARIAALEKALQEEQERKREPNLEEQSVKEDKTPLEASEEYGEQEQDAVEQEKQRDSEEEALEQENLRDSEEEKSIHLEEESETVVIEEASERREIPVFVEARSSFFSPALPSSGAIKEFLQAPKLLRGEIREYLADPEEAMLKEKEKTGHKSTSLLFTISLLLMFFIGLYLSNGNPAASLQFSLLYALSFLLLPFFLVLFFSEGRSFSSLFYLFTRGRLALYLLASLSFFSLLLGFPLFSLFLFLLGIPLGIVLDYTALKIEYGQSGKVLKICFLYSVFALSLFLFFGFCFVGFSLLNYILGRLWEGNLNLKGFLEFLLSHFPE